MSRTFTLALLCAFLWGCGKANDQATKARTGEAPPVGGSANTTTDTSPPFDATFAVTSGVRTTVGPNSVTFATSQTIAVQPDGMVYEGDVVAGKANGQGTLRGSNGTHQYGEWWDGLFYRISGTWVGPDGTREVGTWNRDGTKSGGTITWKDGRQYKGDWKVVLGAPESPDGFGQMTWPDGRKYVGQFRDGKMDGLGKMTYPDGRVEDGSWNAGKFTRPAM